MRQVLLVFGPLVLGAAFIWLVWFASDRSRTRYAFLGAALGSVVVAYEALLFSLCGLGENRPEGFQCHPGSNRLVLLGIPVLLLGALGVRSGSGSLSWVLGAALLVAVLVAPLLLHLN